MINLNDIQKRLILLVENRNYFFKSTTKEEADLYLKKKTSFSGLTEMEIQNLEKRLDRVFPGDFKEYLSIFGRNCGDLFCCGQDIEPEKFDIYQKWAAEIVQEQGVSSVLTDKSFVFSFHQGYSFFYYKHLNEDPSIYLYVEGDPESQKMYKGFTEFLTAEIERLENFNKRSAESNGHFITIKNGYETFEWPTKDSGIVPRSVGDSFFASKDKTFVNSTFLKTRRTWWQKLFGSK